MDRLWRIVAWPPRRCSGLTGDLLAALKGPALLAVGLRPVDRVIVPTVYRAGTDGQGQPTRLAMLSTYAQFGSAQEVALSQIKIELMFPADAATEAVYLTLASPQP